MTSKSLPKTSPTKLYHVTQIILLMWSFDQVCSNVVKFAKYSISMTEVIITSILEGFDQKKQFFFEGCFWFKFNNLGLALAMALKFNTNVVERLKLKVRNFWELIPIFVEVIGEKLVRGLFLTLQT